jgi:predicted site-specific integrase-resolvase
MAKTTIQNAVPLDTMAAATKIGCDPNTLRNYIRDGRVDPPRTPSGRLCWFDQQIEQAREVYRRNCPGRGRRS